jgi:hypothetical protein
MSKQIRHGFVAVGLVVTFGAAAIAGTHAPKSLPVATGDLGEVVVTAPRLVDPVLVRDDRTIEIVVSAKRLPKDALVVDARVASGTESVLC